MIKNPYELIVYWGRERVEGRRGRLHVITWWHGAGDMVQVRIDDRETFEVHRQWWYAPERRRAIISFELIPC